MLPAAALAPLISGGFSLLGGIFDTSEEDKLDEQRRANKEQERLSALTLEQRKREAEQQAGVTGIGLLANMRGEAMQNYRHTNFRNALVKAATGGKVVA